MSDWDKRLKDYGRLAARAGTSNSGMVMDIYASQDRKNLQEAHAELLVGIEGLEKERVRLIQANEAWHLRVSVLHTDATAYQDCIDGLEQGKENLRLVIYDAGKRIDELEAKIAEFIDGDVPDGG